MPDEPNTALTTTTPAAPVAIPCAADLMAQIIDQHTALAPATPASVPLDFSSTLQPSTGVETLPTTVDRSEVQPAAEEAPIEAPAYSPNDRDRTIAWSGCRSKRDPQTRARSGRCGDESVAAGNAQHPHNHAYLLRVLGLDPETAARQVAARNHAEYQASQTLSVEMLKRLRCLRRQRSGCGPRRVAGSRPRRDRPPRI